MSVHPVTYYQAKCDRCGYIEEDYDDFSAFADSVRVLDEVYSYHDWVDIDGRDLCPDCYVLNDDEEPVEVKK